MRFLICLICLIPTLVSAQSKATRTCRILFPGAPADAPAKLHLFDGTASQEVELSQMNLSPVYKLPAGKLVLSLLPAVATQPQEVSPDAPMVTVDENITDFYLLVSSDPANKIVPVKLQVIDLNPAKSAKGQMIWFNLTANSVSGKVGAQELSLEPKSKVVLPLPTAKAGEYPVNLTFRSPAIETDYPLCETKWSHDGLANTLFFVVLESGNRAPRILGYSDYRNSEKKKSKKQGK